MNTHRLRSKVVSATALATALVAFGSLHAFDVEAQAQNTEGTQPAVHGPGVRQTPAKAAWEWTIDERLTVRLDPAKIAERQIQKENREGKLPIEAQAAPERRQGIHKYSIDGKRNPELLLPHELFGGLISGLKPDADSRERQRKGYRVGVVSFWGDEDLFWARLSSVAGGYVDYIYAEAGPSGSFSSRRGRDPYEGCRLAFTALAAARRSFGEKRFDQFLYEVVAPTTWLGSATSSKDPSVELGWAAEGCPDD